MKLTVTGGRSSLYPGGCGETIGNGQAEVLSSLADVVKLTGTGGRSSLYPGGFGETSGNGQAEVASTLVM